MEIRTQFGGDTPHPGFGGDTPRPGFGGGIVHAVLLSVGAARTA